MNLARDDEAEARAELQTAVGDSFEVRERIGRGGYADVFCAFDPRLKRTVAIKVLRRDLHATPELIERFRREAESIAALRHPNLLPIHDIGEHAGKLYLVFEHIRGESLDQYIKREQQAPIEEAMRILREVAGALFAAHAANVVHRDLKPSNIMLEGAERRALLMDFGLAEGLGQGSPAAAPAGFFLGTPHYISPEQAAGDVADQRTDVYALGVVGYELIAGRPPFDATTTADLLMQHLTRVPADLRTLRPDCPTHVAAAIERCLAKSPAERWQTAAAFGVALVSPDTEMPATDISGGDDLAPRRRAFRRTALLAVLLPIIALAIDAALGDALSWSLVLVGLAPLMILVHYAKLWRGGDSLPLLIGRRPAPSRNREEEEFGRHAAVVHAARRDRARIVRVLSTLTRLEQQQLKRCGPAADALLSRCLQHARQLRSLDQQVSAERARTQHVRTHKLLGELLAAREHTAAAMAKVTDQLAELRDLVERSQANAQDAALELQQLLASAERSAQKS